MQLSRSPWCRTVLVSSLVLSMCTMPKGDERPNQKALEALIERLRVVLPNAAEFVTTSGTCDAQYRCQDYRVHSRGKGGGESIQSSDRRGPTDEGFRLRLTAHRSSCAKLIAGSASGGSRLGLVEREYYWKDYVTMYNLPNDQGCIQVDWEFGANTDAKWLTEVHKELDAIGKRVVRKPSAMHAVWLAWEDQVPKLEAGLVKMIEKEQPAAMWHRDDHLLVCEFNIQMYDVHAVDENGKISAEAHQEVGPREDGFIIKLSQRDLPVNGDVPPLYWSHHTEVYGSPESSFRLDVHYGAMADKSLLAKVTAKVEEIGGPGSRWDRRSMFLNARTLGE